MPPGYPGAAKKFEAALHEVPQNASVSDKLATTYGAWALSDLDHPDEALQLTHKALKIDPSNKQAREAYLAVLAKMLLQRSSRH